ncbi:MAG: hypothetical protein KGS45_06435 [Planctomycetes bacterium]|nr:hypothetical protein [Planctomycetota bacterium]
MHNDPTKPNSNHNARPKASSTPAGPGGGHDDVMSLLAEFESSVANLKKMAVQNTESRGEIRPEGRSETRGESLRGGDQDRLQNLAIRAELEELRTTLSRRALEMDQRAFDLDRRRRELDQEAEQVRKALAEQLTQAQMRENLAKKHETEMAARFAQMSGQMQECDRSRVLAEEKFKATEIARAQAEARARELESQIAASASGADVESKLVELSNRIAQADAELTERRRQAVLEAELLAVAEQKRQEAENKCESSRQHLWSVERELGETRDRLARLTAEGMCDTQIQQAMVQAKARIGELERQSWLHQQEVDRARDERAEALKDAERAGELCAKAEAVAQHTVAAVEALKLQVTARTAEMEKEREELTLRIASLQAELEETRTRSASVQEETLAATQRAAADAARKEAQQLAAQETQKALAEQARHMAEEHARTMTELRAELAAQAQQAEKQLQKTAAIAESEREARLEAEAKAESKVQAVAKEAREQIEAQQAEWKAQERAVRESFAREQAELQERASRQSAQDQAKLRDEVGREVEARVRAELAAQFEQRLADQLAQQLTHETTEQVRQQLAAAAETHAAQLAQALSEQRARLQSEWRCEIEQQYQNQLDAQVSAKLREQQEMLTADAEKNMQQQDAAWKSKLAEVAALLAEEQAAREDEMRQAVAARESGERERARFAEQIRALRTHADQVQDRSTEELNVARAEVEAARVQTQQAEHATLALIQEHEQAVQKLRDEHRHELASTQDGVAAERKASAEAASALEAARVEAAAMIEAMRQEMARMQSANAAFEEQIAQQDQAITALKSCTDSGKAQAASAEEQRLIAERAVADLRQQVQNLQAQRQRDAEAAVAEVARAREELTRIHTLAAEYVARQAAERAQEQADEWSQRVQATEAEVDQMRARLAEQQAAAAEAQAQWEARVQRAEASAQLQIDELTAARDAARQDVERLSKDQDAAGAETERMIESLRREVEQTRANHREAELALLSVRTEAESAEQGLRAQIDELRVALAAATAAAASSAAGSNQADVDRIRFLEKQLAASAEQTGELEATVSKLAERLKQEVQQRREGQQVNGVFADRAQWTVDRAERLRTHRRLRRQQIVQLREAGEVLRKRFEICEQVLAQRAQLAAAHQVIQETQRKQASQRAVGRAATVMGHSTIVLAILAGLSWALAGQISPGRFAARATLEADGKGRELATEELKEWQKFHEEMLGDPQFAGKVAEHMKRFAMGALAEPSAVAQRLKTDMSFESARPGVLTVELRGDGPERTARELNAITTKLAAEAVEARARRIDGAVTVISKEAAADPKPIDSTRLQVAGAILGGCALFGIFVATFIYRRLAAAKQKFERDIALEAILDASRWPKAGEPEEKREAASVRKAA